MDKELKLIIRDAAIIWGGFFIIGLISRQILGLVGFTLGSFVAIINFVHLMRNTRTAVRSGTKAGSILVKGYAFRYMLVGVALLISVKLGMNSLVSCAIGLFVIRFAIIERQVCIHFSSKIKDFENQGGVGE